MSCDTPLKLRQRIDTCYFCKKFVCTDCSNRGILIPETTPNEVRICHVCKINSDHRRTLTKANSAGASGV
jgi:hypothetical protein